MGINLRSMGSLFSGGGEMGALMQALDWSETAVGPVANWPQSLKIAVRIILTSRYPMFVWWGVEDLVNLYNDPYRAFLGTKHPTALGKSGRQVWAEIWDQIGPRAEAVLHRGESTYDEAAGTLGNRGPDRQRRPHSDSPDSAVGKAGAGRVDRGRGSHKRENIPSCSPDWKSLGCRDLRKRRLVRRPEMLSTSGTGAYCAARPTPDLRQAVPLERWRTRTDPVSSGACICVDHRTISRLQTESWTSRQRSVRSRKWMRRRTKTNPRMKLGHQCHWKSHSKKSVVKATIPSSSLTPVSRTHLLNWILAHSRTSSPLSRSRKLWQWCESAVFLFEPDRNRIC